MADEPKKHDVLELAPETRLPEEDEGEQGGFWKKLKRGLFMTHTELIEKVSDAMSNRVTLDDSTLDYLEEILIGADLGVDTSLELVERVKKNALKEQTTTAAKLRKLLSDEVADVLNEMPRPRVFGRGPMLTLVVGVNGVGKTTSIAKLARRHQQKGERVMLAAGDTFRAAAIEQLALWGDRLGVEVVRQGQGADPGAVVYDAIHAARARRIDQLIVDTAGRLHTKDHLMAELSKVRRVIDREAADWQKRTILVLDATTGQNALAQARTFSQVVPIDGVLLAKLDGTAKGGMVVAIARELRLPVLYLGVGEKAEDLVDFRPREFASALVG
ncbi:MAG TPA: signal recognition particle-docking protein FtsY [Thermoanaerobaculia bacterium]|jgi:fused signal recognition particle receptor|nr:signal recognition particle-docking protein FtsY [Thermoanaerobaculia bacterium]